MLLQKNCENYNPFIKNNFGNYFNSQNINSIQNDNNLLNPFLNYINEFFRKHNLFNYIHESKIKTMNSQQNSRKICLNDKEEKKDIIENIININIEVIKNIIKNNKNNNIYLHQFDLIYNPFTGKKLVLEDNNINNIIDNNNNENEDIINKKNTAEDDFLKKSLKYYFYTDNSGKNYKYSLNKIYNSKKIYYFCYDTKYNGIGSLSLYSEYSEKDKEIKNIVEFTPKNINNIYHSIPWEKHSYNRVIYMKNEIDNNKITIEKLKNPFYRLDYLKEFAFRNIYKDSNEI